jgi:hypothetical protein
MFREMILEYQNLDVKYVVTLVFVRIYEMCVSCIGLKVSEI